MDNKKDVDKAVAAPEPKNEMEEMVKTLSTLSEQMLRLQAEFDNYKKRTAKEKEALVHQSEARLMLRMLPVYEEIKLAEKEAAKIQDEAIHKGILLVLGNLRKSFEKEGLQEMKLEGEKFDPFRHEAAMHESSELPEGTIVRVIKKGYTLRGEMLQHAIVSVSSGKKKEEVKEEAKNEEAMKEEKTNPGQKEE
ncbi:MAG: nucleotide exchange factor GrpE [Candidatus Micrarchaeota archaeon]|nr:nucleotide exchange factor GrpE [Candidatus Micrarchaeota archaeon]